jgi:MFS family permease
MKKKTTMGMNPIKVLFAMEYVLQGIANPFQGITYHSFFRHFHFTYGMTEAATQGFFSKAYLAWSFKPIIGFFMDAYGKTRTILIFLLLSGVGLYLLTPLVDKSALVFFWMMFALSVLFAGTDVAVDRATIITGNEESVTQGKSKAATVGINQAICWAAIYGTSIIAAFSGGWIADNVKIHFLLISLAIVPAVVFLVVLRLPKDTATSIPLRESVTNFWKGLNTGPVLWIILFFFLFHFQPAMGALWTNYLITQIKFTQTQIGYADSVGYFGYFVGVLLFAWLGIKWQERLGLRTLFKIFIMMSICVNLTQYLMVEPWFSETTYTISTWLPGSDPAIVRWVYFAGYNFLSSILISLIRMSTFSLVGAVIPVAAAGSLFAGFMSVANLAYSFSYASGAWLYENGMRFGMMRAFQDVLFNISASSSDNMSVAFLIFIGSLAFLLSFLAVHMLPDKHQTQAVADKEDSMASPDRYKKLGQGFLRTVNRVSLTAGIVVFCLFSLVAGIDILAGIILTFLGITFLRKAFLDWRYYQYIGNRSR